MGSGGFKVIPVIDLAGGRVVHAVRGARADYRPLSEAFGLPDDPVRLAEDLRGRLGPRPLYVADLDALSGRAPQLALLGELAAAAGPLWVDAGAADPDRAGELLERGAGRVVVALETLAAWAEVGPILRRAGPDRLSFGLDLRDGRPVRAPAGTEEGSVAGVVRRAGAAGFEHFVVVDLARVGAGRGLPVASLPAVREAAPGARAFLGGGARSAADLARARELGAAGVLVATALHAGRLDAGRIRELEGAGGA